jgi:phasin family protein
MSVDSAEAPASANGTTKIRELFAQYRLPGVDVDAFIAARQSDIDAISKATAAAYAGVQSITEKQAELLKAALGELKDALPAATAEAGSGAKLEAAVKKQSDLVQTTLTRTLGSMKEMAEAAQHAQLEVFNIGMERARGSAAELRTLFASEPK